MDTNIRQAILDDVPCIVNFTYLMLSEMASMGGRPLVDDFEAKASLAVRVRECLEDDEHLILLAENQEKDRVPVGFAEARIFSTAPFFIMSRVLHLHSVYVSLSYRRVGIGEKLIQETMDWGRVKACQEAELNALVWNPARSLYQKLGFQVREYRMTIEL